MSLVFSLTSPLPFAGAAADIIAVSPTKKAEDNEKSTVSTVYTTTVVYQKEPPQESPFVTFESLKKSEKQLKNRIVTEKEISDNDVNIFDKKVTKEVVMYSGIPNVLIKLNRTSRKQLSMAQEAKSESNISKDLVSTTPTIHLMQESIANTEEILIDPKIEDLNANFSENNESEIFIIAPTKIAERLQKESDSPKDNKLLTVSVGEEQKLMGTTEEPMQPAPQPHPKPNRKRQLTRPQNRSFYPYFFSRVLG